MNVETRIVAGQPAWIIENQTVRISISQLGGMMSPVEFRGDPQNPVQPYYMSPWQEEAETVPDEPVLVPLRGDFFCLPFGAGSIHEGTEYVTHGEPATSQWESPAVEISGEVTTFSAQMTTRHPAGRVTKTIQIHEGRPAVYTTHTLSGYSTQMPLGHHATLAADPESPLKISTSPIEFGRTAAAPAEPYSAGEYFALLPETEFSRLESVPTRWKNQPETDCSIFPNRDGFVDIAAVFQRRPKPSEPTWVAAVNQNKRYLWFSLKDPAVLPATVIWMENCGRHQSPWCGRNRCIGLEEVCSYFADGVADSVQRNVLNDRGIPTAVALRPDVPTNIRYIQGAISIPSGFDRVKEVQFDEDSAVFHAAGGGSVTVPVRVQYLFDGRC